MLQKLWYSKNKLFTELRLNAAYSRAAATCASRQLDRARPSTWEFAGFSQHGEDGITDYLCSQLLKPNRYFVEIGAANGLENCSSWLALARSYGGVMIEGSPALSAACEAFLQGRTWSVRTQQMMVTLERVPQILKLCAYPDPDVFIIDIDGIDFYILKRVLELGCRPKILVVEYNSAFGPERACTVPYDPQFHRFCEPTGLYYGVSIAAWKKHLNSCGYCFVTVDTSGCNAFFIDPKAFTHGFADGLHGISFLDNCGDRNKATEPYKDEVGDWVVPPRDWRTQMNQIRALELVDI